MQLHIHALITTEVEVDLIELGFECVITSHRNILG